MCCRSEDTAIASQNHMDKLPLAPDKENDYNTYTTRFFIVRHAEPFGTVKKLGYYADPATGSTEPCVYDDGAELSPQGMEEAWRICATIGKIKEGDDRDVSICMLSPLRRARETALCLLAGNVGQIAVHETYVSARLVDQSRPIHRRDARLPKYLTDNYAHPVEQHCPTELDWLNEISDGDGMDPCVEFGHLTGAGAYIRELGDYLADHYAGTDIVIFAHQASAGLLVHSLLGKYAQWQPNEGSARKLHKNHPMGYGEGYVVTINVHETPNPDNSIYVPQARDIQCEQLKPDYSIPTPQASEIAMMFYSSGAQLFLDGMLQNVFPKDTRLDMPDVS